MIRGFLKCLKHQTINETDSGDRINPLHGSILTRELMEFYEKYEKVTDFLDVIKSLDVHCKEYDYGGATLRNGMYLQALGDGIMEVEKLYNENFGKLERAYFYGEGVPELAISDPNNEISGSHYFVANVLAAYTKILQMINTIVANDLHGCQILDLCLKFKYFLPEEIFCVLLNYLNKPLLKQIASWIVFGKLEDPRDEFFIKHVGSVNPNPENSDLMTSVATDITTFNGTPSTDGIVEEIYEIENKYLPIHVSLSLANKILNTGKLISLLRHVPLNSETLPSFQNGDFGINEEEIIKTMKDIEKCHNFDLSKVEKVVHFVWNSVNKVK